MVSVEIKIVTTESDPYARYHGMTVNQSLDSIFWSTQPGAVFKTSSAGFTYTKTVNLAEGSHYVLYGNSAAASYPWHTKIYAGGTLIAEGDVVRGSHLRGDFTVTEAEPEGVTINVFLSPAKAGFLVWLQWLSPTGWMDLESGTTDATGKKTWLYYFTSYPQSVRIYLPAGQVIDGVEYEGLTTEPLTLWETQEGDFYLSPPAVGPPPVEPPCVDPFPWATSGPYEGGTVTFVEEYRGWGIWYLTGPGGLYGITDPNCVDQSTFAGTVQAARGFIDEWIGVGEPYTQVTDFVVPASLPAGAPIGALTVVVKNAGTAAGYLEVGINSERYTEVMGNSYPTQVAVGGTFTFYLTLQINTNMPNKDFNLTATNYEGTSYITKTILLQIAIHTTLTLDAPDRAGGGRNSTFQGYYTRQRPASRYQPIQSTIATTVKVWVAR